MRAVRRTVLWLATNLALAIPAAVVSFSVVWVAGSLGLRDRGVDPISLSGFSLLLIFFSLMWPFYMAALVVASRERARRFRRWAVLLAPMLGLLLLIGNLFINVPEIQAAYLFYVLYGLSVIPYPVGENREGTRLIGPSG